MDIDRTDMYNIYKEITRETKASIKIIKNIAYITCIKAVKRSGNRGENKHMDISDIINI